MADQVMLDLHPLCSLFPRLEAEAFQTLKEDIQRNGQREPIVMLDGMVLDGGNRARACAELGIEPMLTTYEGNDATGYVLSVNLRRRHLSPGQQAAIVATVTNWTTAYTHGGKRRGAQAEALPLETVGERAAASGTSERTQRLADAVAKASPELAREVVAGHISLPQAAAQIAKPKPTDQVATLPLESDPDLPGADDLAADFEALRKRNDELEAAHKMLAEDDPRAGILALTRRLENATRQHQDAQASAVRANQRVDFYMRQLQRCGRAIGVSDLDAIAPAVEAFARQHVKKVAA